MKAAAKARPLRNPARDRRAFTGRATVVFAVVVALLMVLFARMVYLTVFQHDQYRTRSNENRIQTVAIAPPRGLIYDRHGKLLADNQPDFSLVLVTEDIDDLDATLAELAALADVSGDDIAAFRKRLARKRRPMEKIPLKLGITPRERAAVEINRHRLPGVGIAPASVRHYLHGPLVAHAVGSVRRIDDGDLARLDAHRYQATQYVGKRGVEAFYEHSLHGEPGVRRVEVDARGMERREISRRPPTAGRNLVLHLDADLQIAASAALGQQRGAIVAIQPASGGILAMVSSPSYDPNGFVSGFDPEQYAELAQSRDTPLLNRATQGLYAPGSTFKPIVGLAALTLGITDWQRTYRDTGEFRLPGSRRAYRDWSWQIGNAGGQGIVNLRAAIFRSSNTYFYDLGSKMEVDALPAFAAQFGYGQVLALDVADAEAGVLPDSRWKQGAKGEIWYPGDTINLSIGQGDLLASPLQLATVAAAIANRGRIAPPRMLLSSDGPLAELGAAPALPTGGDRIDGPTAEDWEQMVTAMVDVVHRGNQGFRRNGTAWFHIGRDIEYVMAGKSGTAQVVGIPQGQEYDEETLDPYLHKHAWFIAFAPVDAPQIAVAVLVENGGGGSSVAAPVARAVLDAYLLPRIRALEAEAIAEAVRARPGPEV